LTTIILARALTPAAYGLWSVIFGLILFLNVLPASLVIYPLTVRLAARDSIGDGSLVKAGLALTALFGPANSGSFDRFRSGCSPGSARVPVFTCSPGNSRNDAEIADGPAGIRHRAVH
jgi:hypothetical protein